MSNDFNPYANPTQYSVPPSNPVRQNRLADLGKRFLGAILDAGASVVMIMPGYILMTVGGVSADPQMGGNGQVNALMLIGMALLGLGCLALLGIQLYLLATRSQTIGKYVMKTQIVDINTGSPAGLVNSFLLRSVVNGIISGIPCVGLIYTIVDICFIFREDRRCIHDLLASTIVVDIS
jgi:uncharacterized RDD family membrane protein YckC